MGDPGPPTVRRRSTAWWGAGTCLYLVVSACRLVLGMRRTVRELNHDSTTGPSVSGDRVPVVILLPMLREAIAQACCSVLLDLFAKHQGKVIKAVPPVEAAPATGVGAS